MDSSNYKGWKIETTTTRNHDSLIVGIAFAAGLILLALTCMLAPSGDPVGDIAMTDPAAWSRTPPNPENPATALQPKSNQIGHLR